MLTFNVGINDVPATIASISFRAFCGGAETVTINPDHEEYSEANFTSEWEVHVEEIQKEFAKLQENFGTRHSTNMKGLSLQFWQEEEMGEEKPR